MKKLIVFDLDGTLADSKATLDPEMVALVHDLLGIKVAVISGGDWPQFEKQQLPSLGEFVSASVLRDKVLPIRRPVEQTLFRKLHSR